MKTRSFLVFLLCITGSSFLPAQKNVNLDFETLDPATGLPEGLQFVPQQQKAYPVAVDSAIKQHGRYSVSMYQKDSSAGYGSVSLKIVPKFSGKKLTLIGFIKTENVTDWAGLWMRVDGNGKPLAFDNMSDRGISGTADWKQYSISLDFDESEADTVFVGGLLVGNGKIWIDHLQLLVDDQDIAVVPPVKRVLSRARTDTAFSEGSGIQATELDPGKIENLVNLGMVWGFLKYYHPAVARGQFNWDAELFRVLPAVLRAPSKIAFDEILEKWIAGLGTVIPCKSCQSSLAQSDIKLEPEYGNIFKKDNLSASVRSILESIKNSDRPGKGYYIGKMPGAGNPDFRNEKEYRGMAYPDAGYRLLALFRYWNMIQYFYPYRHLTGEDWNTVLAESLPGFMGARDSVDYTLACLRLIARVHDTHANIWGNNKVLENYRGRFHAPVQTKFISGSLVVTGYYTDTLGIKDEIKIGDVITAINGIRTEQLVKDNLPLTPASNYETQLRDLPGILMRSNRDSMRVHLVRGGKDTAMDLRLFTAQHLYLGLDYLPHPHDSSYKIIDDQIGYVFPGKYRNAQLEDIEKTFANTRGMIIDMRCYPSEFMPFTFGDYVKPVQSPFVKFTSGSPEMPGLFRFGQPLQNGSKNAKNYTHPVVIIVNALTQSQAEYTTMAFQSAPGVVVIGSTTAGADGNVSPIYLPGGIFTMISGIGVYYPDGTETQRKGVRIDKVIYPTLAGITAGRDELLEDAIRIIREKNR